mgnify:CR=1 FL=1
MKQKIGIIGLGMVGGAMQRWFEKQNYEIFLYDKFKNIGSIYEVNNADFIYICVPTPTDTNGCDTSIIEEVLEQIAPDKIVIIKCTVPPGTTDRLQKEFQGLQLLHNPEFLTESTADQDMAYPDRQIVGYTDRSYSVAKDIILQLPLAPFERIVPAKVSEMVKYFNNCWFGVKVVFANQMYDICRADNIDYELVRELAAADKRIGPSHLDVWHKFKDKEYRGYAGKCLPKDCRAFIDYARDLNCSFDLLEKAQEINEDYKDGNKK